MGRLVLSKEKDKLEIDGVLEGGDQMQSCKKSQGLGRSQLEG